MCLLFFVLKVFVFWLPEFLCILLCLIIQQLLLTLKFVMQQCTCIWHCVKYWLLFVVFQSLAAKIIHIIVKQGQTFEVLVFCLCGHDCWTVCFSVWTVWQNVVYLVLRKLYQFPWDCSSMHHMHFISSVIHLYCYVCNLGPLQLYIKVH
jgi:hypothetical protein